MEALAFPLDYEDDWDKFIEEVEQMQAMHDSGNCADECIFCEEEGHEV